jgi:hypothetical protein
MKEHGGEIFTPEILENDIQTKGLPILRKAQEIIEYFQPKQWIIENPSTGRMKKYIDDPFYDADYCKYTDWGYKKSTRFWTNIVLDKPLQRCNNDCINMCKNKHKITVDKAKSLRDRYRVPPLLIHELFSKQIE